MIKVKLKGGYTSEEREPTEAFLHGFACQGHNPVAILQSPNATYLFAVELHRVIMPLPTDERRL